MAVYFQPITILEIKSIRRNRHTEDGNNGIFKFDGKNDTEIRSNSYAHIRWTKQWIKHITLNSELAVHHLYKQIQYFDTKQAVQNKDDPTDEPTAAPLLRPFHRCGQRSRDE
jgi:hypothetical protein